MLAVGSQEGLADVDGSDGGKGGIMTGWASRELGHRSGHRWGHFECFHVSGRPYSGLNGGTRKTVSGEKLEKSLSARFYPLFILKPKPALDCETRTPRLRYNYVLAITLAMQFTSY